MTAREHRAEVVEAIKDSEFGLSVWELSQKWDVQPVVLVPVFDDLLRNRKIVQLGQRRTSAGVLVAVYRERI